MFEKATRMKLRFETSRGMVTVEDLWDMPLTNASGFSLDEVAKALSVDVKDSAVESFVVKKSRVNATLELQFEIVKRIIAVKLEEREQAKDARANKAQKEKILGIIAEKEDDDLKGLSTKELKKMAKKL